MNTVLMCTSFEFGGGQTAVLRLERCPGDGFKVTSQSPIGISVAYTGPLDLAADYYAHLVADAVKGVVQRG